jgi:hypothetical protein
VAELLGLADNIQNLFPLDQMRAERRHRRIAKFLETFAAQLQDARSALRIISSVVAEPLTAKPIADNSPSTASEIVRFDVPKSELPVLARGLDQLHVAIRSMTKAAFALEAASTGVPDEVQRYYRISQSGAKTLALLQVALNGDPTQVPKLLDECERFLGRCSETISERDRWLES